MTNFLSCNMYFLLLIDLYNHYGIGNLVISSSAISLNDCHIPVIRNFKTFWYFLLLMPASWLRSNLLQRLMLYSDYYRLFNQHHSVRSDINQLLNLKAERSIVSRNHCKEIKGNSNKNCLKRRPHPLMSLERELRVRIGAILNISRHCHVFPHPRDLQWRPCGLRFLLAPLASPNSPKSVQLWPSVAQVL